MSGRADGRGVGASLRESARASAETRLHPLIIAFPLSFPPPQQNSYMGKGVTKAVDNLNKLIAPALVVRFG
jgi:hypothetical protein